MDKLHKCIDALEHLKNQFRAFLKDGELCEVRYKTLDKWDDFVTNTLNEIAAHTLKEKAAPADPAPATEPGDKIEALEYFLYELQERMVALESNSVTNYNLIIDRFADVEVRVNHLESKTNDTRDQLGQTREQVATIHAAKKWAGIDRLTQEQEKIFQRLQNVEDQTQGIALSWDAFIDTVEGANDKLREYRERLEKVEQKAKTNRKQLQALDIDKALEVLNLTRIKQDQIFKRLNELETRYARLGGQFDTLVSDRLDPTDAGINDVVQRLEVVESYLKRVNLFEHAVSALKNLDSDQ